MESGLLMRTRLRAAQWLSVLLLAYAGAGHAALGGAAETFDTQASTLVAGVSAAGTAYLVRNTLLATGTRVSEYVSAGGVVFAVTWDGPMLPDLKVLLGKHFDTMVAESARRPKAGPGRIALDTPDVVINSGGHMRAFEGSAWIPAQLPAGFSTEELR